MCSCVEWNVLQAFNGALWAKKRPHQSAYGNWGLLKQTELSTP